MVSLLLAPFIIVTLGLLVIGGVVLVVALLTSKRARPLIAGLLAFAAIAMVGMVLLRVESRTSERERIAQNAEVYLQQLTQQKALQQKAIELRLAMASPEEAQGAQGGTIGEPMNRTQLVAELQRVERQLAAHQQHTQRQAGVDATAVPAHAAPHQWTAYAPLAQQVGGPTLRLDWAMVIFAIVGLAVLYGLMRLLNHRDGRGGPLAVGALIGVAVVLGWMAVRMPGHESNQAAPGAAIAMQDDWDAATRPRIDLSGRATTTTTSTTRVAHPQAADADTAALLSWSNNTRRITAGDAATSESIAQHIANAQQQLKAGELLRVETNGATLFFRGRTSPDRVLKALEAARDGGVAYTVVANGRELTYWEASPVEGVLEDIQQIFRQDNQRLALRYAGKQINLTGALPTETLKEAVQVAKTVAQQPTGAEPRLLPADQPVVQYEVTANGQRLTFSSDTPVKEAIDRVEGIFRKEGRRLKFDYGLGRLAYTGTLGRDRIGDALHQALVQARGQALEDGTAATPDDAQQPTATNVADTSTANETEDPRPAWVDQPPKRIGEVYRRVVEVGPYATTDECYQKLGEQLLKVASEYGQQHGLYAHAPQDLGAVGLTEGYLMQHTCADEYVETFYSDAVGRDMKRLYVQMEFDAAFRERVQKFRENEHRRQAADTLFGWCVGVLLLVGGVYALLKLDEATRGYYTKRLFVGIPAAIIGVWMLVLLLDDVFDSM